MSYASAVAAMRLSAGSLGNPGGDCAAMAAISGEMSRTTRLGVWTISRRKAAVVAPRSVNRRASISRASSQRLIDASARPVEGAARRMARVATDERRSGAWLSQNTAWVSSRITARKLTLPCLGSTPLGRNRGRRVELIPFLEDLPRIRRDDRADDVAHFLGHATHPSEEGLARLPLDRYQPRDCLAALGDDVGLPLLGDAVHQLQAP